MRLADVSLLARDVHSIYVANVSSGSTTPTLPINLINDGLIGIIGSRTNLAIEINCLPWSEHMIRATLRRYADRAIILYSHELNACWSRFCICKEAYHLLSGDDENYTNDPVSLVNGLLNDVPVLKPDDDVEAEWMAVFGAMELLIPNWATNKLYELEASGKNHYDIAYEFRVPEKIVSLRLSPNVREILDTLHNEML